MTSTHKPLYGPDPDERIAELEALVRDLVLVVEDFLPNIGKCVLQDYARLNDSLLLAAKLAPADPEVKDG